MAKYFLIVNDQHEYVPVRTAGYGVIPKAKLLEWMLDPIWFGKDRRKVERAIDLYTKTLSNLPQFQGLRVVEVDVAFTMTEVK